MGRYRDRNSYRGKRTEGRGQRDRYKYSRTEVKAVGQVDMDRDRWTETGKGTE